MSKCIALPRRWLSEEIYLVYNRGLEKPSKVRMRFSNLEVAFGGNLSCIQPRMGEIKHSAYVSLHTTLEDRMTAETTFSLLRDFQKKMMTLDDDHGLCF